MTHRVPVGPASVSLGKQSNRRGQMVPCCGHWRMGGTSIENQCKRTTQRLVQHACSNPALLLLIPYTNKLRLTGLDLELHEDLPPPPHTLTQAIKTFLLAMSLLNPVPTRAPRPLTHLRHVHGVGDGAGEGRGGPGGSPNPSVPRVSTTSGTAGSSSAGASRGGCLMVVNCQRVGGEQV